MITAETIDRIARIHVDNLPVLTVYARVASDGDSHLALQSRLNSLLRDVRSVAEDRTLDRAVRMSVRGDLERIEAELAEERWRPGSLAFFCCSGAGIFEQVQLPRQVHDRAVLNATPYVRPLLAVLEEYHRTCIVVVDKESARLWELYQDELGEERHVVDEVVRKPDFGGWYGLEEHRVRNHAGEVVKRHLRQVAAAVEEVFRRERFALLLVGGHEHEVGHLVEQLTPEVRARLAGTFTVDPAMVTRDQIRENADRLVGDFVRAEQSRRVDELLAAAATEGAVEVGLERCLWAASVAAVASLLVDDDVTAPGVVCDSSGWLALSGDTCPLCGGRTRQAPDVVDELVQKVVDAGGKVEHVRSDTALREHQVMAALRFPLPPEP